MPGLFSISGLASGLDTAGMIEKIMEFSARPIELLNGRIGKKQTLLTAYKTFEANLLALKVDLSRLAKKSTFEAKTVSVSDETVLAATVNSTAPVGVYTLGVNHLAQNHQMASQAFADIDATTIGTGTISIAVGDRDAVEIAIDENNNTLEGVARAINDADAGVSATVVNSGDPDNPYRLILSAEHTGSQERIQYTANLGGGAGLEFGRVGPVVPGIIQGTSTVTASGGYRGDVAGTIAFTVDAAQGAGRVGQHEITISYSDGADISGNFVIPSDFVPGDKIEVVDGVELSFSAGTLSVNDTWAVDVTPATIQAPQDAEYSLGTGDMALTMTSASNTVTDLIEGLTIDLLKASETPVTLNINNDTEGIKETVTTFVDQYNAFVEFMNGMFSFDPETNVAGDLLHERAAQEIYSALQAELTESVFGLDGALDHLVELGVRMNADGTLTASEAELSGLLAEDLEAVMKLFVTDGETTDSSIQFLIASSRTEAYGVGNPYPDGYGIKITQAAEKAFLEGSQFNSLTAGNPLVVDGTNERLRINVDGKESSELIITHGSYESGDDLAAEIQKQLDEDSALSGLSVTVRYVDDGGNKGHLEFLSENYGSTSRVEFLDVPTNSIMDDIGLVAGEFAEGKDVEGTIAGEAATGVGQILTGDKENKYTDGLQLLVTLTADQLATQGEDQGTVKVTRGFAGRVANFLEANANAESGKMFRKQEEINTTIEKFQEQIDKMEERLEKKRERLVREFTIMESLINDMQGQGDYLAGMLQNLQANSSMIRGIG